MKARHLIDSEEATTTVCGLARTRGRPTIVVKSWQPGSLSLVICERCQRTFYERELAQHTSDLESDSARSGKGPYDLGRVGRSGVHPISAGAFESNRRRH
jgi:hypothetical protein